MFYNGKKKAPIHLHTIIQTHRWEDKIVNRKLVVGDSFLSSALDVQDGTFNVLQHTRLVVPLRRLSEQEKHSFRRESKPVKAPSVGRSPEPTSAWAAQAQASAATASATSSSTYPSYFSGSSTNSNSGSSANAASARPDTSGSAVKLGGDHSSHAVDHYHQSTAERHGHERMDPRGGVALRTALHGGSENDVGEQNMVWADANEIQRMREVCSSSFLLCVCFCASGRAFGFEFSGLMRLVEGK